MILLDIDHFKRVNDTLGHLAGDDVLRRVVAALQRRLRQSDVIARWGGEEIIVLAHDCDLEAAARLAEEIRAAVAGEPLSEPDEGRRATISAGVTQLAHGDDADRLVGRADDAMYRAKAEGRNRVVTVEAASVPA